MHVRWRRRSATNCRPEHDPCTAQYVRPPPCSALAGGPTQTLPTLCGSIVGEPRSCSAASAEACTLIEPQRRVLRRSRTRPAPGGRLRRPRLLAGTLRNGCALRHALVLCGLLLRGCFGVQPPAPRQASRKEHQGPRQHGNQGWQAVPNHIHKGRRSLAPAIRLGRERGVLVRIGKRHGHRSRLHWSKHLARQDGGWAGPGGAGGAFGAHSSAISAWSRLT